LIYHRVTATPGPLTGISCTSRSALTKAIFARAHTHITRGGPQHPSKLRTAVCEHARPGGTWITFRFDSERHHGLTGNGHVLVLRPSER
jgi:hypothetical protein